MEEAARFVQLLIFHLSSSQLATGDLHSHAQHFHHKTFSLAKEKGLFIYLKARYRVSRNNSEGAEE